MDQTMEKNTCLALSLEFANFRIALNACLFQFAIYTRNTILEKLCIMEYYALCARNDFVTCRQQLKWNFNRIFYNRWLIPRIQLNNHSCFTEKDHFCWEYIYNTLYINTSIYTKFDLRFELSFLELFRFLNRGETRSFPRFSRPGVTAATTPVGVYETILSVEIRIRRKSSNRVSCTYKVSTHSRLS